MMLFVGTSMEIMPLTDQESLNQFEDRKAFAASVALILEKRGPKLLETSMCAPGYWVPAKLTATPASRLSGSFLMNKNFAKDGQTYAIVARSVKDFAGKDFTTNDFAIKSDIAKDETGLPFVATRGVASRFVATVQDLIKSTSIAAQALAGINPEAKVFVPSSISTGVTGNPNPHLASNEEFIASYNAYMARLDKKGMVWTKSRRSVKPRDLPARVVLFKDVPNWLNLSDVVGLVYGGAVEHIFRSQMAEITVIFCEEAACSAYLSVHGNGIRVKKTGSNDEYVTMLIEKAPRGQEITSAMQNKIASGGSRVVRVDGVFDAEKTKALTALALNYELDHMQFYSEKEKAIPAFFFFCGIVDAWAFKQKLDDNEEWANHTAEFVADPCKVATGFHDNVVPNRMAAAVVAAA